MIMLKYVKTFEQKLGHMSNIERLMFNLEQFPVPECLFHSMFNRCSSVIKLKSSISIQGHSINSCTRAKCRAKIRTFICVQESSRGNPWYFWVSGFCFVSAIHSCYPYHNLPLYECVMSPPSKSKQTFIYVQFQNTNAE